MIQFVNVDFKSGAFALNDLSLEIAAGERVCLLGTNGSGKSTLLKLAAGLLQPSAGDIRHADIPTHDERAFHARRADIGFIFQNPEDQILTASVASEMAFTLENLLTTQATMAERITAMANRFNLVNHLNRHPATLSAGELQRLALAATLISHPKVLILDEPSSYLDASGRKLLNETIFASRDWSILAATQDPSEIANFDRVLFLKDGRIAFDDTPQSFVDSQYYREILSTAVSNRGSGTPSAVTESALCLRDLSFHYPGSPNCLEQISLEFPRGQITAVTGDSGSGKTTLALLIAGLLSPSSGQILFNGKLISDSERLKNVGLIFQIPESAIFAETVYDEVAFGLRNDGVHAPEINSRVENSLIRVGLDPNTYRERNPFTLSAGEQRLLAIASILALNRPITVFDESTAGLDWLGKARIRDLVISLKSAGKTVIIISHDREFVSSIADAAIELP